MLIDVDGVISLFGFSFNNRPAGHFVTVDGIPHFISATAGKHLRNLSQTFELAWCTGWEEKANEYLPQALGLPGPIPHLTFPGSPGAGDRHWKLDTIDRHAGPHRPLAWIDDDHCGAEEWATARPGPTLLLTAQPPQGLTQHHVHELQRWATQLNETHRP